MTTLERRAHTLLQWNNVLTELATPRFCNENHPKGKILKLFDRNSDNFRSFLQIQIVAGLPALNTNWPDPRGAICERVTDVDIREEIDR